MVGDSGKCEQASIQGEMSKIKTVQCQRVSIRLEGS